ncbi:hypothetical protein L916_00175, partial [Phytophthora nicotianae]
MVATTRSRTRSKNSAEVLQLDVVQQIRTDRILLAQNKEKWIVDLKAYLSGDLEWLDSSEARACGKIVCDYDVDDGGLLLYCLRAGRDGGDRDRLAKLVVPEDLQQDVLHHYHTILEGGHQGVGRTYQRVSSLVRPVQECATCIAMDHIPSLPRSYKGNTELLIWVDLFTGYVIAKASASRTAQTITESYEECVFCRFGASEAIWSQASCLTFSAPSTAQWDISSAPLWRITHKPT